MKSVFNKVEKEKSKEIVFPVLAEATSFYNEGTIVLLISKNTGVVVKGNHYNHVGELCCNYAYVTNESHWRILSPEESIVLSND